MTKAYDNPAYQRDEFEKPRTTEERQEVALQENAHPTWNNSIEFLMSCIAISVGFGNIWRFPFTAYENGGGAFLIPYVILLFLVGKPFYFLEMIIGQFSGRASVKVWSLSPALMGVGCAQFCSTIALITYYSSIMALTLFFLIASFSLDLPWARCREEWNNCVDSSTKKNYDVAADLTGKSYSDINETVYKLRLLTENQHRSSAELYFSKVVLHEKENIDNGIGLPDWRLTLCLFGSWLAICLVTIKGVKSSGRASYFLAIFPYVVLIALLCRAATLPGAGNGILFFVTPNWLKLLDPSVWYAAVTQCFFSLSVCFGSIITYSAHNDFRHNIYRDVMIVTSLDTVTSMIAGCTIFGILGNLAHEMDVQDISKVVKSGAGLAFVSYPDAIAKFNVLPQLFSVLFFVMMFVLGVGSSVGMASGIVTVLTESFPKLRTWQIVLPVCTIGFIVSTVYVTPGGQFILTLVDYYGTSFVVFILASFEVTGVIWIYGFENFLDDVEFMLQRKPSVYWRICWFLVTPVLLIIIFLYTVITLSPLTYGGKQFPTSAHAAGAALLSFGILQIPFWMMLEMFKHRRLPFAEMLKVSFSPSADWGPRRQEQRTNWVLFVEEKRKERSLRTQPVWLQNFYTLFRVKMR